MTPRARSALSLLGLLTLVSPLGAQEAQGALEGVVRALGSGEPVKGAVILLSGTPRTALAGPEGEFHVPALAPGRYGVRVVAFGFADSGTVEVTIQGGRTTRVEVVLEETGLEIPGITVTASRSRERPGEAPVSVAVLSGEEIERRNVLAVDEALKYAPGVIFNGDQMDIRGASGLARGVGSRALMLVDGHRVLSGTTSEIAFDVLPILDVERIEVVKGPHSALYGSNALGGVVNLITTEMPEEPRTTIKGHWGGYDVPDRFAFTDRRLDYQGLDVQHQRRFGRLGTTFFAGLKKGDGFRENGEYERWLLRWKGAWPAGDPNPVEAFVNWAREDKEQFFTWASEDEPLRVDPQERGDWLRSDKLSAGATVSPWITSRSLLRVKSHLQSHSVQNHFHDNEEFHRSTRVGTDVQLNTIPDSRHNLALGSEVAWTGVESSFLGNPGLWDLSLYAQDDVNLTRGLELSAGLRVDYHTAETAKSETVLNPKLGLVWIRKTTSWRISLSRGYRAPSPTEQFVRTQQFGFNVVPNPGLLGERAWAGEVGMTARIRNRLWLDAGVFQTEYDGLIEPSPVPGQFFTFQFRNVAEARIRGVDLGARVGVVPDLISLNTTYTYLDTEDQNTGEPLPYRSAHNVTATLQAAMVGLDVRYRSRVEKVLAFPLDERHAFTLVDLRVGWRLLGLDLQAKIQNVFQEDYVDVQERRLGAPRSVQLTAYQRF